MKLVSILLFFCGTLFVTAQAYMGRTDQKFQVGANLQDFGSGISASYDYGLGPNISVGMTASYVIGVSEDVVDRTVKRFDTKARFNAHLGPVMGVSDLFDLYPGLDIGLKNLGFHTGVRYFFSDGLGVYSEIGFPIAKYKTKDLSIGDRLHNQFTINFGATFNFL